MRLDGGAMFGVVPKPLWERRIPADERNRIPLALRCLLRGDARRAGAHRDGHRQQGDRRSSGRSTEWRTDAGPDASAGPTGCRAPSAPPASRTDDVTVVIDTHLHFDHAGGNTFRDEDGGIRLSFPRRALLRAARASGSTRTAPTSGRAPATSTTTTTPFVTRGGSTLLEGDAEVVPGVSVFLTPGHTPSTSRYWCESRGETACFLADVLPTMAHLPLPWIMGYDVEPLVTLESKRATARPRARGEVAARLRPRSRDRLGAAARGREGRRAAGGGCGDRPVHEPRSIRRIGRYDHDSEGSEDHPGDRQRGAHADRPLSRRARLHVRARARRHRHPRGGGARRRQRRRHRRGDPRQRGAGRGGPGARPAGRDRRGAPLDPSPRSPSTRCAAPGSRR